MPALRNSLNIRSRVMWVRAFFNTYKRRVIAAGGVIQNEPCAVRSLNNNLLRSASWALVPSGIEEDIVFAQKPTSGLGDLTFTRASDATYTDSTGVVRRSPYNLFQQSEAFNDGAWSKLGSPTVVANAATAPNGTLTADSVTGAGSIIIYQGLFAANTYTQSCYAKAGTGNVLGMYFGSPHTAVFNLATGTVTSQSGGTASIQSVGNGWYRCILTATLTANQYAGPTFTPNGTVFLWGAQLVEGTEALDYFPTTNRQDVPRIDFRNADGTLSSCGRLLLEPQRTNSIRNSSIVGAVAGSPGTLPTNWTASGSGLSRSVVGFGVLNGLPYIDVRIFGTATNTFFDVFPEASNTIAATSGQTWSNSLYLQFIATPNPPVSTSLAMREFNSSNTFLAVYQSSNVSVSGATIQRFTQTRAIAQATAAFVQPSVFFTLTNGATYDFTIRIAAPQMELGAYATTWVPTTTAAVTRLADAASKTGVSSLIGQTEGTLFLDLVNRNYSSSALLNQFTISTGLDATNRCRIFIESGFLQAQVRVAGAVQAQFNFAGPTNNAPYKVALAYKQNDFVMYVNGIQIGTDNSGNVPACSRIAFDNGGGLTGDDQYINQAALFTTRLTNAQLAQLTTL